LPACCFCRACPWCYGRWVTQVGRVIGLNEKEERVRVFANSSLFGLEGLEHVDIFAGVDILEDAIQRASVLSRAFARANSKHLAACVRWLDAYPSKNPMGENAWKIRIRMLGLLKTDEELQLLPSTWTTYPNADSCRVSAVVESITRYPLGYMFGNVGQAAQALQARAGVRSFEFSGLFRKSSQKSRSGKGDSLERDDRNE